MYREVNATCLIAKLYLQLVRNKRKYLNSNFLVLNLNLAPLFSITNFPPLGQSFTSGNTDASNTAWSAIFAVV